MRLVLCVCLVLCAGCDKPGTARVDFRRVKPPNVSSGATVAKFDGDLVTDTELKERFAEMNPYARARYQTVEQRREYVEGLVRFELLAQEAVRRGLASDPEVVESTKRVLVQQLLRKELDERSDTVSEAQIKQYYEAHKSDYVKPAMTRLSHLFVSKQTQGGKAKAEEVLATALTFAPLDYASFQKLAREKSEDPRTKALDGDMRFLSNEELEQQYGAELVPPAATLKQAGEVYPALVETKAGWHVLKLQGRQIALDLSMEQAKPSIQSILANDSKQERFRDLIERLKKQAGYEVNEPALAAIVVDPKAPAVEAKTPQPSTLPAPPPKPPER